MWVLLALPVAIVFSLTSATLLLCHLVKKPLIPRLRALNSISILMGLLARTDFKVAIHGVEEDATSSNARLLLKVVLQWKPPIERFCLLRDEALSRNPLSIQAESKASLLRQKEKE